MAGMGEFDRVGQKGTEYLLQAHPVLIQLFLALHLILDAPFQPARFRVKGVLLIQLDKQVMDVHRFRRQLQRSGFDFRKIEDLVNEQQ